MYAILLLHKLHRHYEFSVVRSVVAEKTRQGVGESRQARNTVQGNALVTTPHGSAQLFVHLNCVHGAD